MSKKATFAALILTFGAQSGALARDNAPQETAPAPQNGTALANLPPGTKECTTSKYQIPVLQYRNAEGQTVTEYKEVERENCKTIVLPAEGAAAPAATAAAPAQQPVQQQQPMLGGGGSAAGIVTTTGPATLRQCYAQEIPVQSLEYSGRTGNTLRFERQYEIVTQQGCWDVPVYNTPPVVFYPQQNINYYMQPTPFLNNYYTNAYRHYRLNNAFRRAGQGALFGAGTCLLADQKAGRCAAAGAVLGGVLGVLER